ncbi:MULTISPECIES: AI-2E family transporter [Heyndrickxia]|jgi:predicted PurR-regulated permease PerM|uniref:AI-2E family transporter n=1 Tax=Heyndrickxia oleronia TaxID=38875 RepID=A0AAW6T4D0_9BACI|nr:AI-2E family transporter [Heyndrickxia oleronia]NYV66789.1 AI-2E family transporter [Bacillus sp. Gen3]OJH16715.1 AI-2E family transporter [Bacillus obstructivus]MBU5212264.1 AI-2E family transporter [Heyndrickxia oleronia]MCI1592222.1 AI-2E family transporter [Heyndrickxia oleronia]MCI1615286.1 AI-2E family transporter [Heyndrickxia oleronia]
MTEFVSSFFKKRGVKRLIIFALIALILYFLRSMMNLILLTFIFAFLMDRLSEFVAKRLPIHRKVVVVVLYIAIVGLLSLGIVKYLPVLIAEITQLVRQLFDFYSQPQENVVINYIVKQIQEKDEITNFLKQGFTFLLGYFTNVSKVSVDVFLSLILSIFYLLEKERLIDFTKKFKESKVGPFYDEIEFFSKKFVSTFGKVIEAQFIIAIVNTVLTTIALSIMGFPQLFGLAIMIFFLGLIPVAGVIISLVPLCFIAYSIGGPIQVLYVVVIVAVVHAVEAYVLNPKLMSSKTNLPVFYTFIVLIFSEHFFGVWGLILGIPVFVFLLDVLDVKNEKEKKLIKRKK